MTYQPRTRAARSAILVLMLCYGCLVPLSARADADPIFCWTIHSSDSVEGISVIPHAGHYGTWQDTYDIWDEMATESKFLGLMLRNPTGPYDGTGDPNALATSMTYMANNNYKLDYVFADFESTTEWENAYEMVDQVRAHTDPDVNAARVGNYGCHPGPTDYSNIWPTGVPRHTEHENYLESEMDLAMPSCYPYSAYKNHNTRTDLWGTFVSPNIRSALFWAPLERFSTAKRWLPDGHEIIPFVAGHIQHTQTIYQSDPPEPEDLEAMVHHLRLRGADGLFIYKSGIDGYTDAEYQQDVLDWWQSTNWFFDLPGTNKVLNLDTNKTLGVEYSAMQRGNRVLVMVSNLSGSTASADYLCTIQGLPDRSPEIATGNHLMLQYLAERTADQDFEEWPAGITGENLGFRGDDPAEMVLATPAGTGNSSSRALTTTSTGYCERTWFAAPNPGFNDNDIVVYSAWLYGTSVAMFAPCRTDDDPQTGYPDSGPFAGIIWSEFRLRPRNGNGTNYVATNVTPTSGHWYEYQVIVDQEGTGTAMAYVRDVTTDGDWVQLVFDDPGTQDQEQLTEITLMLSSTHKPSEFEGWNVYLYNDQHQIDNFSATLYPFMEWDSGPSPLFAVRTPEPGVLLLLGGGLLAAVRKRRRMR